MRQTGRRTWGLAGLEALSLALLTAGCGGSDNPPAPAEAQNACGVHRAYCGGTCVSTQNDPNNCGACGHVCSGQQSCVAGGCVCASGLSACGMACVDLTADAAHCGSCENACSPSQVCSAGKCSAECAAGTTRCDSSCPNLETSSAHCGACSHACEGGSFCSGGECVCSSGQTLCGGRCADLNTDPAHCGSCANACPNGTCVAGACTGTSADGSGGKGHSGSGGGSTSGGSTSTGGVDDSGAEGGDTAVPVGEPTCESGVQTGDECNPSADTEPCVRSDRTCQCGVDSLWVCSADDGSSGGSSGTGGSSTGGGGSATGGAAGAGSPTLARKFVGNITTGDSVDASSRSFSDYWDQITPENAGKWGSVQWGGGSYNWGTLDAIYDYAESNDIVFKEHTFIWGSMQPSMSIGEAQVKDWMNAFCSRYPNTRLIDVVNEPPPHTTPAYINSIGGGDGSSWAWIANAFKWAREACPNAILILNDYNVIEWPNDTNHMISIVKAITSAGAPIDAVGAQAHDMDVVSFSTVKGLLTRLHDETGLPVYITEYDPSTADDNQQLNWYKEQIPYFYELDYVHGITIWGWIYGQTWASAPQSGLIRNGSPRPAMTWLMDYLGRQAP